MIGDLNWTDERYVRAYTRDTPEWCSLTYEAQALYVLLRRKVDRAGVLDLGKVGLRGLAGVLGHPHRWDVVEPSAAALLDLGAIELRGTKLVVPDFLPAEDAKQGDRRRQEESRARRRETALAEEAGLLVTKRDGQSRNVTARDAGGGAASHDVTPCRAVPYRAGEGSISGGGESEGGGGPPPPPARSTTKRRKASPRATGTNPRKLGTNPRSQPVTERVFGGLVTRDEPPEPEAPAPDPASTWGRLYAALDPHASADAMRALRRLRQASTEGARLVLAAPAFAVRDFVLERHGPLLDQVARELGLEVDLVVEDLSDAPGDVVPLPPALERMPAIQATSPDKALCTACNALVDVDRDRTEREGSLHLQRHPCQKQRAAGGSR